jgi:hypothetical protein
MKRIIALVMVALPVCAMAQGLVEAIPVTPAVIYPSQLRSVTAEIVTDDRNAESESISFNDAQVVLNQITLVANAAPEKGACKLLISINDVLATVGRWDPPGAIASEWEPTGGIVASEWQPPGAIVGIWQPPGGIVMTPNDAVVLEVQPSSAKEKGKGGCAAEFVVLGTALIPPQILTD